METISIDHSRKDYGVMLFLGALMFGASLYVLLGSIFSATPFRVFGIPSQGLGLLAGCLGTLFFGYGFFFILRRFLFPKGALVITAEGIINQTNAIGTNQVIPFHDMEEAKLEIVNAKPHIGISMIDDAQYLQRLPWLKRKAAEINHNKFDMSILSLDAPINTREELNEVIEIINERIQNSRFN